jgi:methanogenic corrinoid protein MtbC1
MYQVGELWQRNKITVAQEHYCTAATQMIMAQLYPVLFDRPQNGKRVVVSCVGNELHEMGARMLSDLFTYEGWDSIFLGAAVPKESLLQTLQSEQPCIVRAGGVHGPEYSFVRGYGGVSEEKFATAAGSGRRLCV